MAKGSDSRRMRFVYNDSTPAAVRIGPSSEVPEKLPRSKAHDYSIRGVLKTKYGEEFIRTLEAIAS